MLTILCNICCLPLAWGRPPPSPACPSSGPGCTAYRTHTGSKGRRLKTYFYRHVHKGRGWSPVCLLKNASNFNFQSYFESTMATLVDWKNAHSLESPLKGYYEIHIFSLCYLILSYLYNVVCPLYIQRGGFVHKVQKVRVLRLYQIYHVWLSPGRPVVRRLSGDQIKQDNTKAVRVYLNHFSGCAIILVVLLPSGMMEFFFTTL